MKLKNVSFIESHFEKIIFAASLAVVLFVAWVYLLGAPNNIELAGQKVEPGKIDEVISGKAKTLADLVVAEKPKEELLAWKGKDLVEDIQSRTTAPVSGVRSDPATGVARYELPIGTFAFIPSGDIGGPNVGNPYYEPKFPEPAIYAWDSGIASIAPEEVSFNPSLTEMFKEELTEEELVAEAFDTPYASIVATWDTATVLEELEGGEEDGDIRKLPQRYNTMAIVDVQLQRQSPRPDGTWAGEGDPDFEKYTQLLPYNPLPILQSDGGQDFYAWDPRTAFSEVDPQNVPPEIFPEDEDLSQLSDETKINHYGNMVIRAVLGGNDLRIVQPQFPQMLNGEWEEPLSPEAKQEIKDEADEIKRIEEKHKDLQKKIDNWSRKITEIEQRPQGGGPAFGAGAGAGGLGSPGGASKPKPPRPQAPAAGGNRQTQSYKDKIAKLQKEFEPDAEKYRELTNGKTLTLTASAFSGGLGGAPFGGPGAGFDGGFGPGLGGQGQGRRGGGNFDGGFGNPGFGGPGGFGAGGPQLRGGNFGREIAPLAQQLNLSSGILSQQEIKIYAHDLTALPGQVYRYRIAIRYTNPLFGLNDMPETQKKTHERKLLITSAWTQWTDPIDIPRLRHYFVQQVTPKPAPGKASLEVWRFFKGQWQKQLFKDVRPGHPVGHNLWVKLDNPNIARPKEERIDFFSGAYLLELAEVAAPKGVRGARNDALAVFVQDGEEIVERLQSNDKDSIIREQLEKQREEEELQAASAF